MASGLRIAAVLSLIASACASGPQIGDEAPLLLCGVDSAGWMLIHAPENADEYRRLAVENPQFKTDIVSMDEWGRHDRETWMIRSSGEVILCFANRERWNVWSKRFWRFTGPDEDSGKMKIADQAVIVTVR